MIELYTKEGKLIKVDNVEQMTERHLDFLSIQFQDYSKEDLEWVKSKFDIDLAIMNSVNDIEISSHFKESATQSSFHFSLPYFKQRNIMVEEQLFLIMMEDRIFSFTSSSLDVYFTQIYADKLHLRKGQLIEVEELFKFQIEFLSDYFADITESIAKRIKQLAMRILIKKEMREDDLDIITQLNFNNMLIKESINEYIRILSMHKKSTARSKASVKNKIDEEMNDLAVVSDYIQFNFERLDDLKENISNKIELEQNKIFKLLTMVTFCISMPTLIAGIYGMNFRNMPELDTQYGYFFALLAMVLSVALPLLYFRRKKWL